MMVVRRADRLASGPATSGAAATDGANGADDGPGYYADEPDWTNSAPDDAIDPDDLMALFAAYVA